MRKPRHRPTDPSCDDGGAPLPDRPAAEVAQNALEGRAGFSVTRQASGPNGAGKAPVSALASQS
jgi:hypothetical protein